MKLGLPNLFHPSTFGMVAHKKMKDDAGFLTVPGRSKVQRKQQDSPSCECSLVGMQRLSPTSASSLLGKWTEQSASLCLSFCNLKRGYNIHRMIHQFPTSWDLPMASATSQELPQPQGDWGGWSP